MSRKTKEHKDETRARRRPPPRMKRKEYERELRRLHGELVAMQEWVKATGAKICIVFEGRDTAGKGGTIKAITERVSPRVFRVVALPAPTEREKSQMYMQRYIQHFPAAGEVVIFDRSWYNRAGVERVMGFCTEEQTERFLEQVPAVEQAMVDSGIILHQVLARGQPRGADPPAREPHRRPAQGLEALRHGPEVVQPLVRLLAGPRRDVRAPPTPPGRPGTSRTPNDKKRGRLNIITHLLSQIPYEPLAPRGRQAAEAAGAPTATASPTCRCATSRRRSNSNAAEGLVLVSRDAAGRSR